MHNQCLPFVRVHIFFFVAAFIIICGFHPTFALLPTLNQPSFHKSRNSRPFLHVLFIRFIFSFNTIHVTLRYFFYVLAREASRRSTQKCFFTIKSETHMHACVHTYTRTYKCTYKFTYVCTYISTYVCTCIYIHFYIQLLVFKSEIYH